VNATHGLVGTLLFVFIATTAVYVALANATGFGKVGKGIAANYSTLARTAQGG
jgi:hypothetical protein